MYRLTASELGLGDEITGETAFNNRNNFVVSAEPIVEAAPTPLSPYEILQEAFTENANGNDLLRIKVKRKTKRHVQVLTEEAKAVSQSYVDALYATNAESLDKESLLAQVDAYYQQLVESGYNKTAAYKMKQSAIFKIRNRFNPEGRAKLFQKKATIAELPPEEPLVPIETVGSIDPALATLEPIEIVPTLDLGLFEPVAEPVQIVATPPQRRSRFGLGKAKELAGKAFNVALLGVALFGVYRLTHANNDLPTLDLPKPNPIARDVSVYTGQSGDQVRAEQRYFTQLARTAPTATPDSAQYPAPQTGSTNPEAPNLSEMKGSMQLSVEYTDGTSYTYQKPVGIENTQDYSEVEPGEELAPQTINGLTIVNVSEVPVVQAHQTWKKQEGPFADISRRANELGDENVAKLAGTKLVLDAEDGNTLNGVITDVELLDSEGASPVNYQIRVIPGFDGYYVLTCNKQGVDGNTNQWMWITVKADHQKYISQ